MTGLKVETVIRTVKKLQEKKLIKIQKGKIYMLAYDSNHIHLKDYSFTCQKLISMAIKKRAIRVYLYKHNN